MDRSEDVRDHEYKDGHEPVAQDSDFQGPRYLGMVDVQAHVLMIFWRYTHFLWTLQVTVPYITISWCLNHKSNCFGSYCPFFLCLNSFFWVKPTFLVSPPDGKK